MNLSNYILRDEQASPVRAEVCSYGTIRVSICIVAIMLLVWASCVHADDTTSGPDASVGKIREKLLALGYEVPEANTKIDPSEWKGVRDFAARHFDSGMVIGATGDVILKHLETTLESLKMGENKVGPFETAPLLCQYRLGVSEYGHLRYVIGGCYGKMPLEKVESINESIALELNHVPPEKEISFYVTTEFKGIKSALVESSESRGHISRALFSNKANKPHISGYILKQQLVKQQLVRLYEQEPCILLEVKNDSIVVAEKSLMSHLVYPKQVYQGKEFRLKYTPDNMLPFITRQTEIVEVRGSKTVPVAYRRGLSNLLQYERVLLTAKGDACEKLEVFRPSQTKPDGEKVSSVSSLKQAYDVINKLKPENIKLKAENSKLKAEIEHMTLELIQWMGKYYELEAKHNRELKKQQSLESQKSNLPDGVIREGATEVIAGKITRVDEDNCIAGISIGSEDGVKSDDRLHVIRGERFICDMIIIDVTSNEAVGTFAGMGDCPKVGDAITNKLE